MDYKYTGIILGKYDVGETDRIYTVYTREAGKIKAVGKGVRRPAAKLAGHLEPITLAEIFIAKSRGMGKITGSLVINNFQNIKSNLELLSKVFYAFESAGKLVADQEKDEENFYLLLDFLENADKLSAANRENKPDILTLGFLFKFLSGSGYRLEAEKCVSCGKKLRRENNFFSIAKGGALCQSCSHAENKKIKISDEAIKLVRIIFQNKIENLVKLRVSQKDVNNLKIILKEFMDWIVG